MDVTSKFSDSLVSKINELLFKFTYFVEFCYSKTKWTKSTHFIWKLLSKAGCSQCTGKVEAGLGVPGQPGLYCETLSKQINNKQLPHQKSPDSNGNNGGAEGDTELGGFGAKRRAIPEGASGNLLALCVSLIVSSTRHD